MNEYFIHKTVNVGEKRPFVVTQCILYECKDNVKSAVAVGISICSFRDQYNKKIGNAIARGRANKALQKKESSSPVNKTLVSIANANYKCLYLG